MAARALSRSSIAAFSDEFADAVIGCRNWIRMGFGCGIPVRGDMATREPRTTAGTTGHPARAATTNAPVWNFNRPGIS